MQEIQPIQNEFASAKERLPKFRAKVEEKRVKATLHQNKIISELFTCPRVHCLQTEMTKCRTEINELKAQTEQLDGEVKTMKPELEKLKRERDEARKVMRVKKNEESALKSNIADRERDLRTLTKKIDELKNK